MTSLGYEQYTFLLSLSLSFVFLVCHTCHQHAKGKASNPRGYVHIIQVTLSPCWVHPLSSQPISSCALYQSLIPDLKRKQIQKRNQHRTGFLLLWWGHEAGVWFLRYTTADVWFKKKERKEKERLSWERLCVLALCSSPHPHPSSPLDLLKSGNTMKLVCIYRYFTRLNKNISNKKIEH